MPECDHTPRKVAVTCACGQVTARGTLGVTSATHLGVISDTEELTDELHETKTSVVDEVVTRNKGQQQQQIEQLTTPRERVWAPSAAAAAEVVEIARELDPAEHLVHYRVRCYELDKRPADREWVRWFIRDQQKLRAEIEQASNTGQQEVADDGTPLSWRH